MIVAVDYIQCRYCEVLKLIDGLLRHLTYGCRYLLLKLELCHTCRLNISEQLIVVFHRRYVVPYAFTRLTIQLICTLFEITIDTKITIDSLSLHERDQKESEED